ncbi:hypothetical protein [Halorhabdus salina]|uniref:hypothetical protein n=1 Tax=Halorhabdus salina TaxID=2750670 RepID=UPI001C674797|nr:hypothetical protein [Halorhabdus salina]
MPIEAVNMPSNWSVRLPAGAMGISPGQMLLGIAFWGAIALPIGYLPLLALGELSASQAGAVIAVNVACLVVGHRYDPGGGVWSPSWERLFPEERFQ